MMLENDLTPEQVAALREINPPHDGDVRKYLGQHKREIFYQALGGAVAGYLTGGQGCFLGDWRLDPRMLRYQVLVDQINAGKQAEAQRQQGEAECDQFVVEVYAGIAKLKQDLAQEKKPEFAYSPALARYYPASWCVLKPPTQEEITKWATPYIQKKVPPILADFVSWELTVELLALPQAMYEVSGVPCLTFRFVISALVRVRVKLVEKTVTRAFCGYEHKLVMWEEELGDFYLGPAACGRQNGFVTPIALLAILAKGEVEGEGIQLTKKDGSSITFLIAGYDGEVTVATQFRQFIMDVSRGKPLANALMGVGVIDGLTARLVQEKVAVLSPPPASGIPARSTGADNCALEAALEGMGYNQVEIRGMIARANLPPWMPIEERVKAVLETNQG